jgi:hypothetical protein
MAVSQLAVDEESRTRGATPAANPKFLLELIIADLHWSSLQIGSLALLSAAAAAQGSIAELHACRHLVYDDTRVMRLALRYGQEAGLSVEISGKLDALYAAIGEALKQMAPFVQPLTLSPALRDQLHRIVPALRKVAQLAMDSLAALETVTRAALNLDYVEDGLTIRKYLARAARGELSDLDRRGVLQTPRLKQRRQSPRAPVSRSCRLVSQAGEFPAEIVDVSREGLGLVCKGPLTPGDAVAVLVGGRRLEATVKRLAGFQIGLVLKQTLPVGDPLFTGG